MQKVCLGAKMCSAISTSFVIFQKVILTAQKYYLTKCHCIALQVCIFAIALTPFSIRNSTVKLAPLKLCDIAAAKSKATWVEITPDRYCFFGSIEIFCHKKKQLFGETRTISKEYRRYSILKVQYLILFETVKTLRSRLLIDTMIDIHSPGRF